MSDDLQRLKALRASPVDASETAEDDYGMFGYLRGINSRCTMLELRLKTGNSVALNYAWLERAEYDPSHGITLQFGNQVVRVLGTKLNDECPANIRLYDGLLRQRVNWIREAEMVLNFSNTSKQQVTAIRFE